MTRGPDNFNWDTDAVIQLKDLYQRQQLSFSRIAVIMGCTRGAAIGKANRLGICDRGSAVEKSKRNAGPAKSNKGREAALRTKAASSRRIDGKTRNKADDDLSDLPGFSNYWAGGKDQCRFGARHTGGAELWRPTQCQFIGDTSQKCGDPVVSGQGYCRDHLAFCTNEKDGTKTVDSVDG